MEGKILVEKKDGYNIWADMNPKTKKLYNFSISGVGVNPKHTYVYVSEAQRKIQKITGSEK
jgi:hypothetical protein